MRHLLAAPAQHNNYGVQEPAYITPLQAQGGISVVTFVRIMVCYALFDRYLSGSFSVTFVRCLQTQDGEESRTQILDSACMVLVKAGCTSFSLTAWPSPDSSGSRINVAVELLCR